MGEEKAALIAKSEPDTSELEREIRDLRAEIDGAVTELDRRRREAMDVPLQVRRHAMPLVMVGVGVGALAAGTVAYALIKAHHDRKPEVKLRKARQAAKRAYAHPERVAQGESPLHMKLLTAGLTALAGAMAKQLAVKLIAAREQVVVPGITVGEVAVRPRAIIEDVRHLN